MSLELEGVMGLGRMSATGRFLYIRSFNYSFLGTKLRIQHMHAGYGIEDPGSTYVNVMYCYELN